MCISCFGSRNPRQVAAAGARTAPRTSRASVPRTSSQAAACAAAPRPGDCPEGLETLPEPVQHSRLSTPAKTLFKDVDLRNSGTHADTLVLTCLQRIICTDSV